MDWFDLTSRYHQKTFAHDCQLSSLSEDWERELVALYRFEEEVNNGAYLQFLTNWGYDHYLIAITALTNIGAHKMAELITQCQTLVDEHFDCQSATREQLQQLMPNEVIGKDGEPIKEPGSPLPDAVLDRIYALSGELMNYPDNIETLGLEYYQQFVTLPPPVKDVKVFVPTRDFDESLRFYTALGWVMNWREGGLAEVELGGVRLYLQNFYAKEWAENFMIYIAVHDADQWHKHITKVLADNAFPTARVSPPKKEDNGAIVTYAWDPCGVLLHFAQKLS